MSRAMTELTPPAPVTLAEFDEIFGAVKNWGRWGDDDELGTLNYVTPDTVRAAAGAGPVGTAGHDGDPDEHRGRPGQPEPGHPPRGAGP